MTYREPLPEGCPPDDAEEINAPRVVYRLVRSDRQPMTTSGHSGRRGRPRVSTHQSAKPAGYRCSLTGATWRDRLKSPG